MMFFTWGNRRKTYTVRYSGMIGGPNGVWLLNESCDQMEWELKSNISLQAVVQNYPFSIQNRYNKPWIVINDKVDMKEARAEEQFEWNFEDGAIVETKDSVETYGQETFFLGFHPYKEIVFILCITNKSIILSFEHLHGSRVGHLRLFTGHNKVISIHTMLDWGATCVKTIRLYGSCIVWNILHISYDLLH
ncbi:hypothetical protein PVAP13_3NG140922 [Panicum virgatum]|uniref:Uncharacterized protein n=1 Tax=Panicum virgatum TaxID=38727 RepID=A0A8T0UEH2_PANVG|nr:hypothetical protein PVAP13_3NG140922 [Panicum virgatum]